MIFIQIKKNKKKKTDDQKEENNLRYKVIVTREACPRQPIIVL
jgi:hypothetical protein